MLAPTPAEIDHRNQVVDRIHLAIAADEKILLPRAESLDGSEIAMIRSGEEPNAYGGEVGEYRYQFEGEDDLLHVMIVRKNLTALSPEEGQAVMKFLLPDLPPALIWLKPGVLSQHFYFGHDELTRA